MEPVLELESVNVPAQRTPNAVLVRNVNWRVMKGERWLISGPARAGKSSLVGVAAGLIRPLAGRHLLFGDDLATLREPERLARRLRVGVVFGGGGRLFPMQNVIQNLALPLRYHGTTSGREAERVGAVLSALGLERYARSMPGDLPRWAAQRVGLARALVLEPSVLLLDEPTMDLSQEETAWWREFVGGGALAAVGPEMAPSTWVLATVESTLWEGWAGRRANVNAGRWRVEADGAGLRP